MPTNPGLTEDGLVIATMEEIRADINARMRLAFGTSLDLSDGTIEGQLIAIVSERLAILWEVMEMLYSAMDPDKATGAALDALCSLTGTTRLPPTYSVVTLTLTGDTGTSLLTGRQAGTGSSIFVMETDEDVVLVAADAWLDTEPYGIGDRVTNGGNMYQALNSGTSGGGAGPVHVVRGGVDDPTTYSLDGGLTYDVVAADGDIDWLWLGEGVAVIDVDATADITGANAVPAFTVVEIVTPISGWLGVLNIDDGASGRDVQSDEELRVFREVELSQPGTSPVAAIRAALLELPDVTAATVFYNNTDTTDGDGVPPHSVEAMVQGGDEQTIYQALFDNVAAGILTHGTETGTVTDTQGTDHTIKFTRPTGVPIYVDVFVTKDPDEYPLDGDDQIKEAIVDGGNARGTGRDAVASILSSFVVAISGVLDVTAIQLDDAAAPSTSTTVAISLRQLATYSTANITVTAIDGVP